MSLDFRYMIAQLPQFADALLLTIMIAVVSMALAIVWGAVLLAPRSSRHVWLRFPAMAYIELMRNSPLLLQVYVIYFGLPMLGLRWSGFVCGVMAIASQHGAFLCEIYRAGIGSVSVKQREAAKAIGMTPLKTLRLVVLPQALVNIAPPIGNQLIILIKDTSLVSAIGIMELTLTGKVLIERSAASFEVFALIGLIYLLLTASLGLVLRTAEQSYRRRF